MQNTISQQGQRFQFDVIVIGSGVAGLSYILELVKLNPEVKNIDDFKLEDITLENYESHASLKAPIANIGGFGK